MCLSLWSDAAGNQLAFSNLPAPTSAGTSEVLVGRIDVLPNSTSPTPEPATLTLMLLGLGGCGAFAWKRRSAVLNS
jgi:hypothetical protein